MYIHICICVCMCPQTSTQKLRNSIPETLNRRDYKIPGARGPSVGHSHRRRRRGASKTPGVQVLGCRVWCLGGWGVAELSIVHPARQSPLLPRIILADVQGHEDRVLDIVTVADGEVPPKPQPPTPQRDRCVEFGVWDTHTQPETVHVQLCVYWNVMR